MGKNVIHIEFIDHPRLGRRHHYFGSKAAIYKVFAPEDVGIGYASLCNLGDLTEQPYANRKCIIRQGELLVAKHKKEEG